MRPRRRNADRGLRELQRRASQGDPDARAEVYITRVRNGVHPEEAAAETLLSMSVAELRHLPKEMALELGNRLAVARFTSGVSPAQPGLDRDFETGGWFPNHYAQNTCPRDHYVEEAGFTYVRVSPIYEEAHDASYDTLILDMEVGQPSGMLIDWTTCRQCGAAWPNTGIDV